MWAPNLGKLLAEKLAPPRAVVKMRTTREQRDKLRALLADVKSRPLDKRAALVFYKAAIAARGLVDPIGHLITEVRVEAAQQHIRFLDALLAQEGADDTPQSTKEKA